MPFVNEPARLELQPVRPGDAAWETVQAFLGLYADAVDDLLVLADVNPPLGRLSSIWLAQREGEALAVAYAFPLWPAAPALGVKGAQRADEWAAIAALALIGPPRGYVICTPEHRQAWAAAGHAEAGHIELHLTLAASRWRRPNLEPARRADFDEIDAFFRFHEAAAWHPIQFETGPYFVLEREGAIVAAAGTHFACPSLVQLGNVFTAPHWRGRGLGAACTAAVVEAHVEQGHRTISLFVDASNAAALHIYKRLGFERHRELAAFGWSREPGKPAL